MVDELRDYKDTYALITEEQEIFTWSVQLI